MDEEKVRLRDGSNPSRDYVGVLDEDMKKG